MALIFNPMLPFNFEEKDDIRIFVKDDEGNDIDITEYILTIKDRLDTKVNIVQGTTNANKVVITDANGNITTIDGVVMNINERNKLASITNPMLLKGVINSYEALFQVESPQVGWCYLVSFEGEGSNIYREYVYTADNQWELLGNFNASVLPQYFGGTSTNIDNSNRVNLQFDPDTFEIDRQNRLAIKDLSYVVKCKTLTDIVALQDGTVFHWQGANDRTIYTIDPDGTQSYIVFGYFYKKYGNNIQRLNKERSSNAIDIVAGEAVLIESDPENDTLTLNVKYDDGNWGIGKNPSNQLIINGKFVKQVTDLDAYTTAEDGEIVEYIGQSDSKYTNGYFYKRIADLEYTTITLPANSNMITFHFPDGTTEICYVTENNQFEFESNVGSYKNRDLSVTAVNGGTFIDINNWCNSKVYLPIYRIGDRLVYNNDGSYVFGQVMSIDCIISCYYGLPITNDGDNYKMTSSSVEQALLDYKELCEQNGYTVDDKDYIVAELFGINVSMDNGDAYQIYYSDSHTSGSSQSGVTVLISLQGKRYYCLEGIKNEQLSTYNNIATDIRLVKFPPSLQYGELTEGGDDTFVFFFDVHYNLPTTATILTISESITISIPNLYNEHGEYIGINYEWQRINVQPTPNVNEGVLLIQRNGVNIESFSANDNTNKIANIIVPTKTSDLNNDSGFITKAVNDLSYYYTKDVIDTMIAPNLRFAVVQSLPTDNISGTTIYLVPKSQSENQNVYDEYVYIATVATPHWEKIGDTTVDLSNYYTKTQADANFAAKSHTHTASEVSGLASVAKSGSYNDLSNKPTIPTVNNATLTIQKNGTNVQTFTANASSNKTANITVPTKVSELTNDSGYVTQVKVGNTAYNPSDGVVSLPAYPTNTDTGATSVETTGTGNVVTTASYSAANRKITLTKGITTLVADAYGETAISSGDDLNDYYEIGTYGTSGGNGSSTIANSLLNKPTFNGGFRLYVESCGGNSDYRRQTVITKNGLTFVRTSTNSSSPYTWTNWEKVISAYPETSDTTTFLRRDGTWQVPQDTNTTYTLSANNSKVKLIPSSGSATEVDLNTLINGLSTGNSDPEDDDYIVAQYAGGGTTTTTYHRRSLSKFWNWIKSKLGIASSGSTYLKKDGTWGTPVNTTYTFATGDSDGQIKVTPSGGSAQNIDVKGLGSAAYTDKQNYWMIGRTSTSIQASSTNTVDLNTYVTPGNYYCGRNADAAYVTNHPSPSSHPAFNLIVLSGVNSSTYIRQIVLCHATTDLWMRYTTNTGATWSAWRNLAKDTTYSAGTGLSLNSTTFSVSYGTTAGTACQGDDSRLSDARTPTNHASNKVTSLTGYSKPSSTSAITTSDSLNVAIGKLEKGLENAISGNPSVGWTRTISIVGSTVDGLSHSCNGYGRVCCGYVHFRPLTSINASIAILRIPNVQASHHVIFPALLSDGEAHIELRIVSDLEKSYTDIEIWGNGPSAVVGRYYTGHFSFITA